MTNDLAVTGKLGANAHAIEIRKLKAYAESI